ncbi:MAG: flavodoxin [Eubacterium sp.]|nr:flavodoxin [Eubacterium sp.]
MKKILPIFLSLFMVLALGGCSSDDNENTDIETVSESVSAAEISDVSEENSETEKTEIPEEIPAEIQTENTETGSEILVAYFSATGTTKALAEYAADALNADIYEIVPQELYTAADLDYGDNNSRSTKEMNDPDCHPAISGNLENTERYSVVFIGYPIWWGEAPRIIDTFMESYDFSGKTVIPFCTSASSGIGSSAKNLHTFAPDTVWLDGDRLKSNSSREDMVEWINGLGLEITAK